MRICFLSNSSDIHPQQWVKFFTEREHDVHTISFANNVDINGTLHYINPKRKYNGIKGGNYFLIFDFPKLKKIIEELKPDVLHAHYVTSYGFLGALTNYSPLIITAHGSDVLLDLKRNPLFYITTRFALKRANLINSVSAQVTKKIVDLGIRREKIFELQYGVDTNLFKPGTYKEYSPEKFRVISTRRLSPIYNLDLLIDAIHLAAKKISNLEVYFLGDGPERERLKRKIKDLGLSQFVQFTGQLPQRYVIEHLNKSDIYISTSKSDGTSLSLLEAMACGLFPIVTDIPANREWIKDRINGFLVPTGNPLLLSERIYEVFLNRSLTDAACKINLMLIREKASLYKNLGKVEELYVHLLKEKNKGRILI